MDLNKNNRNEPEEKNNEPEIKEEPKAEAETVDGKTAEKAASKYVIKPGKLALAIAALVLLVAVLAALVIQGMDRSALVQEEPETTPDVEIPQSDVFYYAPEVGNPDDETCKGIYTATDEEVMAAKDTVVATAGAAELTLGQLQFYYWQEVGSWLNQYGSYAQYFGLDINIPLEYQECTILEGRSWQQYFLMRALNSWVTYAALNEEALEAGFEMDQEYQDVLATMIEDMDAQAVASGFESAADMLAYNIGVGIDLEEYRELMTSYYRSFNYYSDFCDNVSATPEEVEQMFALHEEEYAANGLTKETKSVNVRHILLFPEGATSETVRTETFPEEAWAAAETRAKEILDQWLAGEATEESFAALAAEHSEDGGSVSNGGLYTDVLPGDMVAAFDAWCFDPARQVGDYGIVETEFGYHIMFYSGETLQWMTLVEQDVINEKINQMVDGAVAKREMKVDYNLIILCTPEAFTT